MEEALLLSATEDRMRVMLRGRADTVEYRLLDGQWVGESGGTVEIAAAIPIALRAWEEEAFRVAARMRMGSSFDRIGHSLAN